MRRHSVVFRTGDDRSVEGKVNKTPCKDCGKRKMACHDTCEEYKEWIEARYAHKEKVADGRREEYRNRVVWNRSTRKRIMGK